VALGYSPFAWNAEKSSGEIEFILETSQGLVPVEVKSGLTSKAKSIAAYIRKYAPQAAYIFGNTMARQDGISKRLPLYSVGLQNFE